MRIHAYPDPKPWPGLKYIKKIRFHFPFSTTTLPGVANLAGVGELHLRYDLLQPAQLLPLYLLLPALIPSGSREGESAQCRNKRLPAQSNNGQEGWLWSRRHGGNCPRNQPQIDPRQGHFHNKYCQSLLTEFIVIHQRLQKSPGSCSQLVWVIVNRRRVRPEYTIESHFYTNRTKSYLAEQSFNWEKKKNSSSNSPKCILEKHGRIFLKGFILQGNNISFSSLFHPTVSDSRSCLHSQSFI